MNTLNWQDAAPESATKALASLVNLSGFPCAPEVSRFNATAFLEVLPGESLIEARDRLRNEINHGEEYLLLVQAELKENRRLLEQWAQYEQTCSLQPLDHLVQSVWLKQEVEKFLVGWLKRRRTELSRIQRKLGSVGKRGGKRAPRRG